MHYCNLNESYESLALKKIIFTNLQYELQWAGFLLFSVSTNVTGGNKLFPCVINIFVAPPNIMLIKFVTVL